MAAAGHRFGGMLSPEFLEREEDEPVLANATRVRLIRNARYLETGGRRYPVR